ncbi:MAG: hypothetical protein ACRDHY_17345 [Anaerolineales bacterium]
MTRHVLRRLEWKPMAMVAALRAGECEAAFFGFLNIDGHLQWFGERSPIAYTNPRVVALLRGADTTADPDQLDRIYRDLAPMLRADLPLTFLFPQVATVVARRRVRGLRSLFEADPILRMEHLRLEDGR